MSCSFYVEVGGLTSAKTLPYLIALSKHLSIVSLISGVYPSSNPSSSWSDERRASAYADSISWRKWAVANVRTVSFAENCNSRVILYFPMPIASVSLCQKLCVDWFEIMTDPVR
jgi:hypothetical protein